MAAFVAVVFFFPQEYFDIFLYKYLTELTTRKLCRQCGGENSGLNQDLVQTQVRTWSGLGPHSGQDSVWTRSRLGLSQDSDLVRPRT